MGEPNCWDHTTNQKFDANVFCLSQSSRRSAKSGRHARRRRRLNAKPRRSVSEPAAAPMAPIRKPPLNLRRLIPALGVAFSFHPSGISQTSILLRRPVACSRRCRSTARTMCTPTTHSLHPPTDNPVSRYTISVSITADTTLARQNLTLVQTTAPNPAINLNAPGLTQRHGGHRQSNGSGEITAGNGFGAFSVRLYYI